MRERNNTFTVLSAIAIILILLGHLDFQVLTLGGLFPYYSYHVMIFVFISGYFYKRSDEEDVLHYLLKRFRRLMIPYFLWNVIYGVICMLLKKAGINVGEDISLYNLILAPFIGGHQFGLNAPAWFVPALFLLQTCDIFARKIWNTVSEKLLGKRKDKIGEWMLMLLYLMVGMAVVALAKRGSVYDWYKLPGRLMLMAPAYQFGRLYHEDIEKKDTIPSIIYFPVLILINLILTYIYVGLGYSTVWVTGFSGSIITPFITTFTGIAFWIRVSRAIASKLDQNSLTSKAVFAIHDHTYDIMMHHLAVFMIIKAVLYLMFSAGICNDMDITAFRNDIYYTYVPSAIEGFKWVYLILGCALPVMAGVLTGRVRKKIGK